MKWTITSKTTGVTLATEVEADDIPGALEALAVLVAREDQVPIEHARRRIADRTPTVTPNAEPVPATRPLDPVAADALATRDREPTVTILVPALRVSPDVEGFLESHLGPTDDGGEDVHAVVLYVALHGRIVRLEVRDLSHTPPVEPRPHRAPIPMDETSRELRFARAARAAEARRINEATGVPLPMTPCSECLCLHRPGENTCCEL